MTKEEKLEILADAEARCYGALSTTSPGEQMGKVLENISEIEWRQEVITGERDRRLFELNGVTPSPAPTVKEPVKLDPIEEPKPAPDPKPGLTADEVKKKMVQYQTAHNLDIAALMQSMGYQKLSAIPAERYGELIELAEAKIKEKG